MFPMFYEFNIAGLCNVSLYNIIQVRYCIRLSWIGLAMILFGLLSVGAVLLVSVYTTDGEEETAVGEQILAMFSTDDEAPSSQIR